MGTGYPSLGYQDYLRISYWWQKTHLLQNNVGKNTLLHFRKVKVIQEQLSVVISNIPWNQGLANYNACMSGTPITAQYSTPTINSLSKHWLYKAYIYFFSSVLRIVESSDTRPIVIVSEEYKMKKVLIFLCQREPLTIQTRA